MAQDHPTPSPSEDDFIPITTTLPTLPLPPNSSRTPITTPRLLLRPLSPTDLSPLHALRTQPEVMQWTSTGRIDATLEETRSKLTPFLPPNDTTTANCAICLRDTGEFIGIGGCHLFPGEHGWPEVGYMIRREYWGMGLGTEFLGGWLGFWEGLPRSKRGWVRVQRGMVCKGEGEGEGEGEGQGKEVREHLIAITEASNVASQKVLLKFGFVPFREFSELDDADPEKKKTVQLLAFRYFPSSGGPTGSSTG